MPKGDYKQKFTHLEVIELLHARERYYVDPDEGRVYSVRTGKPLFTFQNSQRHSGPWVRLYASPRMITLPVSHCVWLFMTRIPIPKGFEIHHRNTDATDNRWKNLFALFRLDHSKLHNGDDLIEETPF